MEISVVNQKGKDTGRKIVLSKEIFGLQNPNTHAIYLDIKQHLANKRQGTHKTKNRSEITGSTRKIKKQKGTGTARAGSIKSPIFRGGGRVFGPVPRSYNQKVNKKTKKLARKSALSLKAKDKSIIVLEDKDINTTFKSPKTNKYLEILKLLGLENKKSLWVVPDVNNNLFLSSRNLKKSKVTTVSELNTYKIVDAFFLILSENSIEKIEKNLNKIE